MLDMNEEEKAVLIEILMDYDKQQTDLLQQLVGSLYPGVVREKLILVQNLLKKLKAHV